MLRFTWYELRSPSETGPWNNIMNHFADNDTLNDALMIADLYLIYIFVNNRLWMLKSSFEFRILEWHENALFNTNFKRLISHILHCINPFQRQKCILWSSPKRFWRFTAQLQHQRWLKLVLSVGVASPVVWKRNSKRTRWRLPMEI